MADQYHYVDLDGTLAYEDTFRGVEHIGRPIPQMVMRCKQWLRKGERIKIFTARLVHGEGAIEPIQEWCDLLGLGRPEVTNIKGSDAIDFWDNRAKRVKKNTGEVV